MILFCEFKHILEVIVKVAGETISTLHRIYLGVFHVSDSEIIIGIGELGISQIEIQL